MVHFSDPIMGKKLAMKNPDNFQMEPQIKQHGGSSGIDPLVILNLLKKNWYLFAAGILIGLFCARFYFSHTMPVYETTATILINESENRGLVDNTELLQGLAFQEGCKTSKIK